MEEKNCAFQYATTRNIVANTALITRSEAEEMWKNHLPKFKQDVMDESDPEMCIWIDMKNSADYHTSINHVHGSDCVVEGGALYEVTKKYIG